MASVKMPCGELTRPTQMYNHIPKCSRCTMWWAANQADREARKEQ